MKRLIVFMMLSLLLFVFSACGNESTTTTIENESPVVMEGNSLEEYHLIGSLNNQIVTDLSDYFDLEREELVILSNCTLSSNNPVEFTQLSFAVGVPNKVSENKAIEVINETLKEFFGENVVENYEDVLTLKIEHLS